MVNAPRIDWMKRRIDSPCFTCVGKRTEDCHGTCQDYADYREAIRRRNTELKQKYKGMWLAEQFEIVERIKNKKQR